MSPTTKKKNPADLTLRNVRAQRARDAKQDRRLTMLEAQVEALQAAMNVVHTALSSTVPPMLEPDK
jgi:hypothetical protein